MLNLFYLLLLSLLISLLILMLNFFFSFKFKDREKMTSFECGFDSFTSARLPFSIQFFTITLLFLIFDIEIILIVPMIYLLKYFFSLFLLITFMLFIFILLLSLWLEWSFNYLSWIN